MSAPPSGRPDKDRIASTFQPLGGPVCDPDTGRTPDTWLPQSGWQRRTVRAARRICPQSRLPKPVEVGLAIGRACGVC